MWNRHLSRIDIAKHRFERTIADIFHNITAPYCAGREAGEYEKAKIGKMVRKKDREPARAELELLLAMATRKKRSLRFCFDYRKLNNVILKKAYPIGRKEKYLNSLGKGACPCRETLIMGTSELKSTLETRTTGQFHHTTACINF